MACFSQLPVTSIISLLVAMIVAFIAYLQYVISRHKLRLDLYSRRFEIYTKTMDYIYYISDYTIGSNNSELYQTRKMFAKVISESKFLFDPKHNITDLLAKIHKTSFQITGSVDTGPELVRSGAPELFISEFQKAQDNKTWMFTSISTLEKKLVSYLNFHKIQ
jgi:hypothetical protein